MSTLVTGGTARAVERIFQLCASDDDDRALRVAVLDELRRVVGFDAYAWLLTDPESEVGSAPLADVPCLPELPRLIALKYSTTVNRWTRLDRAVATLRATTGDRRDESLVWREMLSTYDVDDVASLVFRDRFGCWGFLDLWRIGSGSRFTEAETAVIESVTQPTTAALRAAQARTFETPVAGSSWTGPAVLVLSPDLQVRAQTAETQDYLRTLIPPDDDRPPVPAGAYNVAAQLLAIENGVDDHPPIARVHLAHGVWLTLRAARMTTGAPSTSADIAVTIEPTPPPQRLDLYARCHKLSPREAELLGLLIAGADTRQLAQHMYLSEHTIQDHLKSMFAKTATRNRRTLIARAAGH